MTDKGKQRQERRKEREHQRIEEQRMMRQRLVRIIDNPSVSDSEALQAISLLWSMDEKTHHY